jgi:hypothetical protein
MLNPWCIQPLCPNLSNRLPYCCDRCSRRDEYIKMQAIDKLASMDAPPKALRDKYLKEIKGR